MLRGRKTVSHELLKGYGIPFVSRGRGSDSVIGKLAYLLWADQFLLREALAFRPDVFLSFSSPYAAHVSSILGKPHIAFDDTESATLARRLWVPFTDIILSPACFRGPALKRQLRFEGFMELLYLHPNVFRPDPSKLASAGVDPGERYSFVRFVSWKATHDIGLAGMSLENKRRLVSDLERFGKVLISSEVELPPDFQKYRLRIDPTDVHHLLSFASLFVGESATMASESAVLGTPAIYLDRVGRGYTEELERRFELVSNFSDSAEGQQRAIEKAIDLLADENLVHEWPKRRATLLAETIDVNEYLLQIVSEVTTAALH